MKRIVFTLTLASLFAAAVTSSPPASAERGDSEYQQHFRRGVELFRTNNHEGALAEFVRAHELRGHYAILLNIAYCYSEMGRVGDAIGHFERYLSEGGGRVPARRRAEVERELRRLRALVAPVTVVVNIDGATVLVDGREVGTSPLDSPLLVSTGAVHTLEARLEGFRAARREITLATGTTPPPVELELERVRLTGRLRVETNPAGARLVIDGEEVGETPWSGDLAVGAHQLELAAVGCLPARREVAMAAGGELALVVELEQAGAPARLHVDTGEEGAVVFIDGERQGTTPLESIELPAGSHDVSVELDGHESWSGEILLDSGRLTTARVELASSEGGLPSGVFWSTFALALATGAGAAVTGALTIARNQELEDFLADVESGAIEDRYSDLDSRRTALQEEGSNLALTTDVLWISSAVFAAATLVLGFFTRFGPASSRVELEAGGSVVRDSASLTLGGRF